MNKAEKYDMKQAYNKDLTKSARFNYLKNAMHDKKGMSMKDEGVMMMGQVKQGSMATMRSGNVGHYTGNHPRYSSPAGMMGQAKADLTYNPMDDIAGQETEGVNTGMMMKNMSPMQNMNKGYDQQVGKPSVASRQKYGGNKGDMRRSAKKDY